MKPKDKAKELVEKYDSTLTYLESKSKAKECALIVADELIEFEKSIIKQLHKITKDAGGQFKVEVEFWEQVKQEIEKL